METRYFKGDKWTRLNGSRIPVGTKVKVIKFYPRRRVMVLYKGEPILTMLWCLSKKSVLPESPELELQRKQEAFRRIYNMMTI